MRIAVYGVIVAALAQQALAADAPFPILRGTQTYEIASPNYFRWEGVYVGGQVGASTGNLDLTHAAGSLISFFTRESVFVGNVPTWAVLKAVDTRAANYGGFIGYNMQFEDVVLGIEGNYNHTSLSGSSADSLGLLVANSNPNLPASDVTVAAVASMRITDYGTLRGRVGWAAGRFLPYAMIGLAAGVADITRSATLTVVGTHCDGLANP
jgi:opacity protein-like surface antigen